MFRDFITFSRTRIFLFSDLLSSALLFSDSSHLCFSICPYIVGSLTSKLPSIKATKYNIFGRFGIHYVNTYCRPRRNIFACYLSRWAHWSCKLGRDTSRSHFPQIFILDARFFRAFDPWNFWDNSHFSPRAAASPWGRSGLQWSFQWGDGDLMGF